MPMKAVTADSQVSTSIRRAERQQDQHADDDALEAVDEMKAPGVDNPEPRHAVMHGMEAPQPRPFMRQSDGPSRI